MLKISFSNLAFCILIFLFSLLITFGNFINISFLEGTKYNLGLDLKGGVDIVLEVDSVKFLEERFEKAKLSLPKLMRDENIPFKTFKAEKDFILITLENQDFTKRLLKSIKSFDSTLDVDLDENKVKVFLPSSSIDAVRASLKEQSIEVIRKRVDEKGNKEIFLTSGSGDQILLQVPGVDNPDTIKKMLNSQAKLSFHLLDQSTPIVKSSDFAVPYGYELIAGEQLDKYGERLFYVVQKDAELDGSYLIGAKAVMTDVEPAISFQFDQMGSRIFARITQDNVGKPFAIVFDNKVLSAPVIKEPILSGGGIISGNYSIESAQSMALFLRAGALPAPIKVTSERVISSSLGSEYIKKSTIALCFATFLVFSMMIIRYGFLGLISSFGVFCNICMIIAGLGIMNSTITLPGIAGIILTIGMSVDANIIIFERAFEIARARSQKLKIAISDSFHDSSSAIFDANFTAIMVGAILYWAGFGPVKGFAITLMLGVVTSVFTSMFFCKTLISFYFRYFKKG